MSEPFLTTLHWLSTTGQTYRLLQLTRVPDAARRLLAKFGRANVRSYGFLYFPRRAFIDKQYESLGRRFANVSCVWAIWPIGAKFFDAGQQTHVVKRLILPNPDSESTKYYFDSIGQGSPIRELIKHATKKARATVAKVRWCDHFLYNSITLADHDEPMGWAHVEIVLPHCVTENRPGYTIYKHRSNELVQKLVEVFLAIWDDSKDAPETD